MMTTGASLPAISPESLQPFIQAYRAQTGRPTTFNEFIAAEIIERLQNGEMLSIICKDSHLPSYATVCDWRNHSPAFADMVARARTGQALFLVEEGKQILDTADDSTMPQVQKADKRAQYRMQIAKCFDRETFGDKVQQDVNVRGVVIHTDNTELARLMNGE